MLCAMLLGSGCALERPPWTANEILHDVEPELREFDGVTHPIAEAQILMWHIERDSERGFIVEEALLWRRSGAKGPGESRALVHAFRHPSGDNVWHRSVSYIETKDESAVPHTRHGYRRFQKQPTATDVCAFLLHVRGLGLDTGLSRVSGGFPQAAWRRLVGRDAPCSFSGEVKT